MSTASAPIEIGHVALTVRDLPGMTSFYEALLGLERLSSDGASVRLGAGGTVLVELRGDKAARPNTGREAGLFHTAFLMPSRADLGAWLIHTAEKRMPLEGASDHQVSEAIYLSDPEGNGIEVYVDRPRLGWYDAAGAIKMTTEGLDLNALARTAKAPYRLPSGLVVGHVHLQVGNVAEAEGFYHDIMGFPITAHYPGAAFYGSGGYHHHLATNIWNSRGAKARTPGMTGLAEVGLRADKGLLPATLTDPWGTSFTVVEK
ncbi:VOC family protein [Stagnihabitans tardus]|uniref:VOC family protein n=1 Tax=Stagnihabitans tardus TaxID=2699202 RepID=A0AAE5BWT1_9RHOB|nr:VOC family protein [Stagnihabitans tardus]NBZ88593.1 VOC family protein [Stagnihabitans tardus]